MTARQSSAVEHALALIGQRKPDGSVWTAYAAAKLHGLALSTIYRAIKRNAVKPKSD